MSRIMNGLLAAVILLLVSSSAVAADQRIVLGILPVYDASAESLAESFPPNLTFLIYQELLKSPDINPVLLSPGGLYETDGEDWIVDYAHKAKVDAVLVTRLLPTVRVNDRRRQIKYEVQVLDVNTGKRSLKALNDSVQVATGDLFVAASNTNTSAAYRIFFGTPQEFRKQPLGRAALKLVDWTREYLTSTLTALQPTRSGADPVLTNPAPCQINFRIRYAAKRTSSKSYSVLANDKDESSTIREGVAQFPMEPGPLAIRAQVVDAPYKMDIEPLYQNSTILDCYSKEHTLVLELGNAGEALLHWE